MNTHALAVLEYDRVADLVAGHASSSLGAAAVRGRRPNTDIAALEAEQGRIFAMRALAQGDGGWSAQPIPDVDTALARLRVEGTTLSGAELGQVGALLRSSRLTQQHFRDTRHPPMAVSLLTPLRERLTANVALEESILRAIDDDGQVRDEASPVLRRIRRELRGAQGELVALLERVMARLESHQRVSDMSVTVRDGRYVIPIRREARNVVGGIVHGTSATGGTLFVEPPAAIEASNRIRELESDEASEVDRILRELADTVRPLSEPLREALQALVELDSLYARARFASDFGCRPVQLVPAGTGFRIRNGRHPLLLAQRIAVVPFDLEMDSAERTLLISGPNTGGKTVLLKTLALISLMLQAGLPAPVGDGSQVAVYEDIFADIGDEQSIEASLSTFSAHLRNLGEILRSATPRALVLIDELGSGTDPLEGAALGGAILVELTTRGSTTVATTHLGALKELATENPAVVNASLQFDAAALAPTYLLIKGIPGRSYGLSIARRLGLPEDVVAMAERRVPQVERDVNALLATLESREKELAEREREVTASLQAAQERAQKLAEREGRLRQRERAFERESRREARQYLLEARSEVERTIRELRRGDGSELDEAARQARQRVERLAADQGERLAALDRDAGAGRPSVEPTPLAVGDWVEVESLQGRGGRLLEIRGDDGVVALGGVKLAFPLAGLRRSASPKGGPEVSVPVMGDIPEVYAPSEVDVRGMRAAEIDDVVMQALDAAIRADLRSLRIIHGKGTGALRDRVAEMLRKDTRVKNFRLGAWNEGGAGVTVAEL